MSDENVLANDKSLQCLRIELNSSTTAFLYYKKYPKEDSKRFPQSRTAIFFYFDSESVNQQILKTYISQIGQIDEIELGNYINKKGLKKHHKIVYFAIVKFVDEESLILLLDQYKTQIKINQYIEVRKNKSVHISYDPMKEYNEEEEEEEESVDSEGFVKVKGNSKTLLN
jgi:hypothetical protein